MNAYEIAEDPERDAMDDLDDAINALVRRGTDTAERESVLAEVLLAGSPFERPERARVQRAEILVAIRADAQRGRLARLRQALAPARCPYCGERVRCQPRLHVAVWH